MALVIDDEFIKARIWLRQYLPIRTRVHTTLRDISRSSMRRETSTVIWSHESQALL